MADAQGLETGALNEASSLQVRNRFGAGTRSALLFIVCAAPVFAFSTDSLWIDEAHAALRATQPTIAAWWQMMIDDKGSDLQMPLYMFYLWVWEKLAGSGEFALRLANLPWFILSQLSLWLAFSRDRPARYLVVGLAAVSPFLWFYLNEARPYIMQYAGACIVFAVVWRGSREPVFLLRPAWMWSFGVGLFVLCTSSMLGAVWAAGAVAAWVYLARASLAGRWRTLCTAPVLTTVALLAIAGGYFLWTLQLGARASVGPTSLSNLLFVIYELSGLSGLGPGRLEIRENGVRAFGGFGMAIALGLIPLLIVLAAVAREICRVATRPQVIAGALYAVLPATVLIAVGYVEHFPLLGRHFISLAPVAFVLFVSGAEALCRSRRRIGSMFAVAVVAVWITSSVSLRLLDRHRKDDYRNAAAAAVKSLDAGEIVWWSADHFAARYYGVPLNDSGAGRKASLVFNATAEQLERSLSPDVIIASKPDIFDASGALADFVHSRGFVPAQRLPAFTIWERDPHSPAAH